MEESCKQPTAAWPCRDASLRRGTERLFCRVKRLHAHRMRPFLQHAELSGQCCQVDDEPVPHIALDHALVGLVHLVDWGDFDVADDVVLATKIEHLLRLLNGADHGTRDGLAADNHSKGVEGGVVLGRADQYQRTILLQHVQERAKVHGDADGADDQVKGRRRAA